MTLAVLGCGFTGERVARRFLNRGARVIAMTRHAERLSALAARGAEVVRPDGFAIPDQSLVLNSLPVIPGADGPVDPSPQFLEGARPSRIVYLSTTGVYGALKEVNAGTAVAPADAGDAARIAAEDFVESLGASSLVLRPAAIYGPGRGVHVKVRRGKFQLAGDGSNMVSRIHVDDLAAIIEAGLLSRVEGRYPVADDDPCSSREIAEFCANLFGAPLPEPAAVESLHKTRRADRKVDGSEIRVRLGVELQYPSYRTGIPASVYYEAKS